MIARTVHHSTFVIERSFAAPPERVFDAFRDAEKKRRWFSCHDDVISFEHHLDFRVDGAEIYEEALASGRTHTFKARFLDIVPEQRIVYAYELGVSAVRVSVSLVTVALERAGQHTKMTFTEQVAFLDGHGDAEERREGTEVGLGRLATELERGEG